MQDIAYRVAGYLTVRADAVRVPLDGELRLHLDAESGSFSGDLTLGDALVRRTLLGAEVASAVVRIAADSPVTGTIGGDGVITATATVTAALTEVKAAGHDLTHGSAWRTTAHATVPLRSGPGFDLTAGGRLEGRYDRPPFTGCGRLTPLVNLLIAGPGRTAVIDLIPKD